MLTQGDHFEFTFHSTDRAGESISGTSYPHMYRHFYTRFKVTDVCLILTSRPCGVYAGPHPRRNLRRLQRVSGRRYRGAEVEQSHEKFLVDHEKGFARLICRS